MYFSRKIVTIAGAECGKLDLAVTFEGAWPNGAVRVALGTGQLQLSPVRADGTHISMFTKPSIQVPRRTCPSVLPMFLLSLCFPISRGLKRLANTFGFDNLGGLLHKKRQA
jgi:hypothetical protein